MLFRSKYGDKFNFGFDAAKGEYVDMVAEGIIECVWSSYRIEMVLIVCSLQPLQGRQDCSH